MERFRKSHGRILLEFPRNPANRALRGAFLRFKDGKWAAFQVLLIAKILVRDDEQIETGLFGALQQFAVTDAAPAHCLRGSNVVADQCVTNLNRHALVEQNLHAASSNSIFCWP
jgi:hypothetical protein